MQQEIDCSKKCLNLIIYTNIYYFYFYFYFYLLTKDFSKGQDEIRPNRIDQDRTRIVRQVMVTATNGIHSYLIPCFSTRTVFAQTVCVCALSNGCKLQRHLFVGDGMFGVIWFDFSSGAVMKETHKENGRGNTAAVWLCKQ